MTRKQRSLYKKALVETLARLPRPLFHVTAMLPPGSGRGSLEQSLRGWAARVDRRYLGRNWLRKQQLRMDGVCFFEVHPYVHAHLVVTPPTNARPLDFEINAGSLFSRQVGFQGDSLGTPVTCRGRMMIQKIGPGESDLIRTLSYIAKETEWRPDALADWVFLSGLSTRQVA